MHLNTLAIGRALERETHLLGEALDTEHELLSNYHPTPEAVQAARQSISPHALGSKMTETGEVLALTDSEKLGNIERALGKRYKVYPIRQTSGALQ